MMARMTLLGVGVLFVLGACSGGSQVSPTDRVPQTSEETGMHLTSGAFEHEGMIPERYTCDGLDVSPPLTLRDMPGAAVTLVLVLDDPDAPGGTWDHWIAYDIPPDGEIPEAVTSLGTGGTNSWGRSAYGGPCPPSGTHRYVFSVYALDSDLGLAPGADKATVLDAISGHVLAEAALMGRYSRS
jgi:Raf kinase inhibitor-like YbhB/YbcL family protein